MNEILYQKANPIDPIAHGYDAHGYDELGHIPWAECSQMIQTAFVFQQLVLWSDAPALGSLPDTGKTGDKEEQFAPQTEEAPGWNMESTKSWCRYYLKYFRNLW